MGFIVAIVIVAAILAITYVGVAVAGLNVFFGIILPYIAIAVFIVGVVCRIIKWAKSPVPFNIVTTCGQEKSLDFIKTNPIDNPTTRAGVVVRMILEVTVFRSLFRNSKAELTEDGDIKYQWEKWLWIFALLFHWGMFFTLLRHFRFFTANVPAWVGWIENVDGVFMVDLHPIYLTGFMMVGGLVLLLLRRLYIGKVRYISLLNDYFPLCLLIGIGVMGMVMRYTDFGHVNINAVGDLMVSLVTFHPAIPAEPIGAAFYMHLALVCTLLIYFPMGKLMHAIGIFMSPTRNMINNSRAKRHINPWNPVVEFHYYSDYEDEFREKMVKVGLPVDKTIEQAAAEKAEKEAALKAELGI